MKVLVAVDHSECSALAVKSLVEQAWPHEVTFRVLNIVEPICVQYPMVGAYMDPIIESQHYLMEEGEKLVEKIRQQIKKALPDKEVEGSVIEGDPADSIVDQAIQWHADLIVVGSHGRKGFQRFLLGSVAERVSSHAPCSVEIVKQKGAFHKQPDEELAKVTTA